MLILYVGLIFSSSLKRNFKQKIRIHEKLEMTAKETPIQKKLVRFQYFLIET